MNLPFFIAKRYLVSKKKQNIINIISWISLAGILVGTMAIIIMVSVMNGFTQLIGTFHSDFDPDIKITSVEGKMFDPGQINTAALKQLDGVVNYAEVVEEMAMLNYGKQQYVANVKGVPDNFTQYTGIENRLIEGEYFLKKDGINYAVVGHGVASNLNIGVSFLDALHIYYPKKGKKVSLNPAKAINHDYLFPSAVFSILEEIDAHYILVSKEFASDLFESGNKMSAIELDIDDAISDTDKIQKTIQQIVGEEFHVKNKEQQHELIYKTMRSEKMVVYLILIFILILASGNMIGNLTMLYIDKSTDIKILRSMGLDIKNVNRIFLYEGWLITLVGGISGAVLGIFVCWLQKEFGLIKLPGANGSFVISAYPVKVILTDVFLAILAVLSIGFVASWYPVKFMSQKQLTQANID